MFDVINNHFQVISDLIHMPLDQTKAVFSLLISFVFGILFSYLKNIHLRYAVGLLVGFCLQALVYEAEMIFTLISSSAVYLLVKVYQRNCVKPVTIFVFSYTSIYHVYRMYTNWGGWKIDASFALMIMIAKFNSFAWCYRDGGMSEGSLTPDQNYRKIEKLPSLLEFFSYSYFFVGGSILSPYFDFKDFELFIKRQGRFATSPKGFKMAFMMLTLGLLAALGYELFTPYFNVNYVQTADFSSKSYLYKISYVFILGYVVRLKFFTGFNLAQASIDACGLSYNGVDSQGKHNWEGVLSAGRFAEISANAKESMENWNSSIHVWLKRCVYQRMIDLDTVKGRKPNYEKATQTTFAVSAFWHGFYPSYYTTFFIMWCQVEFGRHFFRSKEKLRLPKVFYAFLDYFISIFGFNYAIVNHVTLDWTKCLKIYQETYCLPVVVPLILISVLKMTGLSQKTKKVGIEAAKEKAH